MLFAWTRVICWSRWIVRFGGLCWTRLGDCVFECVWMICVLFLVLIVDAMFDVVNVFCFFVDFSYILERFDITFVHRFLVYYYYLLRMLSARPSLFTPVRALLSAFVAIVYWKYFRILCFSYACKLNAFEWLTNICYFGEPYQCDLICCILYLICMHSLGWNFLFLLIGLI